VRNGDLRSQNPPGQVKTWHGEWSGFARLFGIREMRYERNGWQKLNTLLLGDCSEIRGTRESTSGKCTCTFIRVQLSVS